MTAAAWTSESNRVQYRQGARSSSGPLSRSLDRGTARPFPNMPPVPDDLNAVFDLFAHRGFLIGLTAGIVAAVVVASVSLAARRVLPGWGILFATAVIVGLRIDGEVDQGILGPLVGMIAAGLLVDAAHSFNGMRWPIAARIVAWSLAAAASVWFAISLQSQGQPWIPYVLPFVVIGFAAGLWGLGRLPYTELAGPIVLIIVGGAWVTVPETDMVNVMLGAALPMALVTLPPIRTRSSMAGALAVAGLFAWLMLEGGESRPWTLAAVSASVALLPMTAVAVLAREKRPRYLLTIGAVGLCVAAITRVADMTQSSQTILMWSIALTAFAGLAVVLGPSRDLEAN